MGRKNKPGNHGKKANKSWPVVLGIGVLLMVILLAVAAQGAKQRTTQLGEQTPSYAERGGENQQQTQPPAAQEPGKQGEQPAQNNAGTEEDDPSLPEPSYPIERGNPNIKAVAFTFDAGSGAEYAPKLLDVLRQYNVKATFFLTGQWMERYPDMARRIVQEGHEVAGNHSFSHPHMKEISREEIKSQLQRTDNLLRSLTGRKPLYFRPPFGEYDKRVLRIADSFGYKTVMWNIDSLDWTNPGADKIAERVLSKAVNGSIILMHINGEQTPDALPKIISGLQAKGYKIVTLSEVL